MTCRATNEAWQRIYAACLDWSEKDAVEIALARADAAYRAMLDADERDESDRPVGPAQQAIREHDQIAEQRDDALRTCMDLRDDKRRLYDSNAALRRRITAVVNELNSVEDEGHIITRSDLERWKSKMLGIGEED